MSHAGSAGSLIMAAQGRRLPARPGARRMSRLFNVCETMNLYYNGLITVSAPRLLPAIGRGGAQSGLVVLRLTMLKAVITILIFAAGAAGAAAAPALDRAAAESGLSDKDFHNRRRALEEVGDSRQPWKLELLKKSFSDEDPAIRERAARLIGRSKDKAAYQVLSDSLKSTDTATRLGALEGLRDLADRRAAVPVAALLSHKDRNTRWKAAEVLGSLKSDNGVAPLRKAAQTDGDEFVRKAAVESLGKIGTPAARAALNSLKAGPDPELAGWASKVLVSLEVPKGR